MQEEFDADATAERLEAALVTRDIDAGFSLLDRSLSAISRMNSASPEACRILLCLAQWIDLGYRDKAFFEQVRGSLATQDRAQLSVLDFLRLTLVDSFSALTMENLELALAQLDLTLRVGIGLLPAHLMFLAHFWKGRVHRKRGEYADALTHICEARSIATREGASRLVAVTRIHESWLVFQRGERRQAFQLLDEAEEELRPTGHGLSLGNIASARGRFIRRSGDYTAALKQFELAIEIYSERHFQHPNLARALVNAAYAKRLIALDIKPKMRGGQARGSVHARYLQLIREALELLQKAGEIYALHSHQRGSGSVLVNAGQLHLESGDTDQASAEAHKAYLAGEKRHDLILMSRARNLQSSVELARSEEHGEERQDVSKHATLAARYSEHAIRMAEQTQNKRLIAEAYIGRGLVAADDFFQEFELAKDLAAKASALLTVDDRDHLFKELVALKEKVLRSMAIDQTLRLWSDGQLGGKTFRQVEEEFAELIIPKVWVNLGRNVTRVATQLSISPKKVRRILKNSRST
jgi:tetratricopeptide (TPR) repeat protein